jgi:hypothetical protein
MPSTPRADRLRALFRPSKPGGIVWAPRPAADFIDALRLSESAAESATADWAAHKAGKPPQWRDGPGGLFCQADRKPATLADICAALGLDLAATDPACRADMVARAHDAARALVLRLCRLNPAGRIVWAPRDDLTSPRTPAPARQEFNRTWAGRPLAVKAGKITVQRQEIDAAQAAAWLAEQVKPAKPKK